MEEEPREENLFSSAMPIRGARLLGDYPPERARALLEEFAPVGGRILDPCAGWGGRLLGFLLSSASEYVGYDPNAEVVIGLRRMASVLGSLVPAKRVLIHEACFEDVVLEANSFDFALTCPPYFDVEDYPGKEQCRLRYPEYGAWLVGFFGPLFRKTCEALKPGAYFACQVGDQRYPLVADAKQCAEVAGFRLLRSTDLDKHRYPMSRRSEKLGGEALLVFRKAVKADG
jgi:hypothetical protein